MPETMVTIHHEADIVLARQEGRRLAQELGFAGVDLTIIATAISELARNIVKYAGHGELRFWTEEDLEGSCLVMQARDQGPGIPDLDLAMRDGYSTGHGLGLGLPGAKRLVDKFDIQTSAGSGTVVTLWKRRPR